MPPLPICLHGIVLNYLITRTTLPFLSFLLESNYVPVLLVPEILQMISSDSSGKHPTRKESNKVHVWDELPVLILQDS
jgi:hypothetical protein